MNPNLILPSGFQGYLERCKARQATEYAKMGDGRFPPLPVVCGVHPVRAVLNEIASDRSAAGLHSPLDDGPVFSLNFMAAEQALQHGSNTLGFGKNQHSAGKLVQTVHNIQFLPGIVLFDMQSQQGIGSLLALVSGRNGEQAGRFVYDKNFAVFVEDFKAIGELGRHPPRPDFQNISGPNRMG